MKNKTLTCLVARLRGAVCPDVAAEPGDGELVERFRKDRDGDAFAALVRRHGPMVLGVCRRLLRDAHDAEDAFQATFLVFVRKAASLGQPERVAAWLHGVAHRTALKARSRIARRHQREVQVTEMPYTEANQEHFWNDLRPVLDEELGRLPERYRLPLLLCDLQGRSRKQVAAQLAWAEGTLSSRLARGRELLRQRLTRRGVVLAAGAWAGVLSAEASPSVPPALLSVTVEAGIALATAPASLGTVASPRITDLTEGVLRAMFLSNLRVIAAVVLCLGCVGIITWQAVGVVAQAVPAEVTDTQDAAGDPKADAEAAKAIRLLLPEASSSSIAEWRQLMQPGAAPSLDKMENQSLTMVLMSLPMMVDEAAQKDFQYLNGIPKPEALAAAASRSQSKGYGSFLQPEFITDVKCRVQGDTARGTVSFRGYSTNAKNRLLELFADKVTLFEGNIEFTARKEKGSWRVEEFRLPGYKLKVVRNAEGKWRQEKLD